MAGLVDEIGPLGTRERKRGRPDDAYGTLVRSITGQQLSTKAAQMEQIAEPWRPHRTLASLYLWESLDNRPGAGKPS